MQIKSSEVIILIIVSLMALTANLPESLVGQLVDRNLLLIALVLTVVISLFLYVKLMLFITVSVLAIGANLPEQFASQLGISRSAMIVASGVLVVMALLYKLQQKMSHEKSTNATEENQEVSTSYRHDTPGSRNDVIIAILKGNIAALHQLLLADVEINFSQHSKIPLFLAIEKGNADVVLLLLMHGAKLRVKNKDGNTPIEFAMRQSQTRIAELILYASRQSLVLPTKTAIPVRQQSKVVILFADICSSTSLYEKLGNEAALHVITRALNILIQEVNCHEGILIKTIGDEIMCSFPNIAFATKAACAMHIAMDTRRSGGDYPIFVRIGMHYGEVIHKGDDVFGDTVNIAARVTAATKESQIMITQTIVDSLSPEYASKVRPVMRASFAGKQDTFEVFQILWKSDHTFLGRLDQTVSGNQISSRVVTAALICAPLLIG